MTTTNERELIDSVIALADAVDPSGKLAKHTDGVPELNDSEYSLDEVIEWVLDVMDAIGEAMSHTLQQKDERLYQFACMVNDGDDIAFDVAENIAIEFDHLKEEEEEE
jgi:hypothetical protein